MSDKTTNLIWIDMEMTDIYFDVGKIIQIAVIITDSDLNMLDEGIEIVVHQPEEELSRMIPKVKAMHNASGLTEKVRNSKVTIQEADAQVLAYISKYSDEKKGVLCGSSIWNDRAFIEKYMPKVDAYIHYRLIDTSTLKELIYRWRPETPIFPKKDTHTALEDIKNSIAELKHYREIGFVG